MNAEKTPVIVGIGEITDRPSDPQQGLEPLQLMAEALRSADQDAGGGLLARVDSLVVINQVTWGYVDLVAELCATLGVTPAHTTYGPIGGESPVRFLHEAAARIARGESRIAAVVGAEAQQTLAKAQKAGVPLPWTPQVPLPPRQGGAVYTHPLAVRLGAFRPVTVYPLYENATAVAWGQTPRAALDEAGELWSGYASIAAQNRYAWLGRPHSAHDIITPTAKNRSIAWPYTKLMVANPTVNQGAALLLTTLAQARQLGIAEERLIFPWGGALAGEPRDWVQRATYTRSDAQEAVLHAASRVAEREQARFDAVELYSCFPCVPKMTRRILGLDRGVVPTTTGGLTFFGAPLNNYMTHAACGMVRHLREHHGQTGLLYGQGGFVTNHHSLVLGPRPPSHSLAVDDGAAQAEVDAKRVLSPAPTLREQVFEGAATVETFTVLYDREGEPEHGVVVLRLDDGTRTLARVPAADRDALAVLTDLDRSPIGTKGTLSEGADAIATFHPVA